MKRSELKQIIREVIQEELSPKQLLKETEEMSDADQLGADQFCNSLSNRPYYYLRGSWNGLYTSESRITCTRFPPGPNQMAQHVNYMMQYYLNNPQYGMEIWSPPTPDFDDAFYDEYEGEYGPFPGQEITPDKVIPGKTPNVMGKKRRRR